MPIVTSPYADAAFGGFAGVNQRGAGTGVPGVPAESYYADPNTGPIAANIGAALFGNPQLQQQRAVAGSEIARNQAQTQGFNLQNTAQQHMQDALGKFGSLFQVNNPDGTSRPMSQQEISAAAPTIAQGVISAFPDPQKAADAFRAYAGIRGDQSIIGPAAQGAGASYLSTQQGQRDSQDAQYRTSTGVAGINAGASRDVANINNAGAFARQQALPVNTPAATTTTFAPGDPRATVAQPLAPGAPNVGALFVGQDTPQTVQARAQSQFLQPTGDTAEDARRLEQVATPTVYNTNTNAASRKEVAIIGADGKEQVAQIGADGKFHVQGLKNQGNIDVQTLKQGAGKALTAPEQTALDADADTYLGSQSIGVTPEARNAIIGRAGEIMKTNGHNIAAAVEQAHREFLAASPQRAGYGTTGHLFSNPYGLPQGYGAQPTPPPAQPGGIVPAQAQPAPAPAAPQAAGIPQGAAVMLRQNPSLAPAFDAKYGPGSAARVMGGA